MSKIAIVTDSTACFPVELIRPYPITVVPLQVIWDGKNYRDGVDISIEEFYHRLKNTKVMPSTSQPSPADFVRVYEDLLGKGYEVLSIHISGKLSGTMDSAIQAKNMLPGKPIELVDSLSTAMALGFQVLQTAKAAEGGATLAESKALAESAVPHIGALFVVSTLEFLHRGGRIGGGAAFLGTALNLKPILELRDGKIEARERVRTMSKAVDRLLDLLVEKVGHKPVRLSAIHADARQQAEILMEKIAARLPVSQISELVISEVSPVIGTHTGPGTVGVTYMIGM